MLTYIAAVASVISPLLCAILPDLAPRRVGAKNASLPE